MDATNVYRTGKLDITFEKLEKPLRKKSVISQFLSHSFLGKANATVLTFYSSKRILAKATTTKTMTPSLPS
jgi:hypothetical protein